MVQGRVSRRLSTPAGVTRFAAVSNAQIYRYTLCINLGGVCGTTHQNLAAILT